jgi:hypothetical protein
MAAWEAVLAAAIDQLRSQTRAGRSDPNGQYSKRVHRFIELVAKRQYADLTTALSETG